MNPRTPESLVAQIVDAIKHGNLDAVTSLLRANPEQLHYKTPFGFQTWLGYAAGHASVEVVQRLLALGFDVNEGDPKEGVKPICDAGYKGRAEIARLLLDAGAVMDTATSIQNPLFAAIVGRSPEVVNLLLQSGIDTTVRYNTETMKNMDAVAFALMQGAAECARIIALWNAKGDEAAAEEALEEGMRIAKYNAFS